MIRSFEQRPARTSVGGFTLVELLVVIAVIAVLIAMLLPALNRARLAALAVTCSSNMRQIHIGMHMYANDFQGAYPIADFDPVDNPRVPKAYVWSGKIAYFIMPDYPITPGPPVPYLGRTTVMSCPAEDYYTSPWNDASYFSTNIAVCYNYNSHLSAPRGYSGGIYGPVKMTKVKRPDRVLLINDIAPAGNWFYTSAYFATNTIKSRHNGQANFMFCDGSVRLLKNVEYLNPGWHYIGDPLNITHETDGTLP